MGTVIEQHDYITAKSAGSGIRIVEVGGGYGPRKMMLCPYCGETRAKLYLKAGEYACRQCHELPYASTHRHDRYFLVLVRAQRFARKLGVEVSPPYFHRGVFKPKRMRWATYWPLYWGLQDCSYRWAEVWLADTKRALPHLF